MNPKAEQWHTIHDMLRSYRAAQILMTCNELDLFRHLANGPRQADELAALSGSHPEALRRLLNAAVALGLLTKAGDTYANSPLATACLTEAGPFYLGHMVGLERAGYECWSRLSEAVRTGRWPEPNRQMEEQADWVRRFELAMYDMARVSAGAIAEALPLPAGRPLRLIDIGGGHGGYSMALARRYPHLTATVFELPAAAAVARDIIAREGLSDRVRVRAGDFQREELGQGYDVALIFGVLVSETAEGKLTLLRKTHTALAPGGIVAIRESWFDPDDPAQSPEAALFSLHTLLANSVGDVATLAQMQDWLVKAGFERPGLIELPDRPGSSLCVAYKP